MANFKQILNEKKLDEYISLIHEQNAKQNRLDGWFLAREIMMEKLMEIDDDHSPAMTQALLLEAIVDRIPLSIRPGEILAGTEDDSFARSYALINPDFKVDTFEGYCDEDAVYNDIAPDGGGITEERITKVRRFWAEQPYAKKISRVYADCATETREVIYFVERVTGHTLPDFSDALEKGLDALIDETRERIDADRSHADFYKAMIHSMEAAVSLAERYSALARDMAAKETDSARKAELELIDKTCARVPRLPARDLYEAIQSYMILWQVMNLEQLPNPFAFSVGNLDHVLQPYFEKSDCSVEFASQLVRHLLAFFCVGDRNWAISQNIMVGGMDENSADLTCDMSYAVMRAFELSNYAQPNLSVKVHPGTPQEFYQAVSRFMFDFGHSTPSFFNDPVVFQALETKGIAPADMPLYGAAGCQEPLIMGKESANTTNSWLNLAKVLELGLNDGVSLISGEKIGPSREEIGAPEPDSYENIKTAFYKYLDYFIPRMVRAANGCTEALAMLPVPFKSAFMGGRETGADMRSVTENGVPYNGSGCLIHGLANVADSFSALKFAEESGDKFGVTVTKLVEAVQNNFTGFEEIRDTVRTKAPRFGNNDSGADEIATELQVTVSDMVNSRKNPLGKPFCADWSTPSTNMLYGYLTGATPDGRFAREILAYGLDPAVEAGRKGLLARLASQAKLNYAKMSGGSAVALSINPDPLASKSIEEKADYLRDVVSAVFGYNEPGAPGLMYAYFNVFSAEKLFDVMEHPEKYPEPVLVRIHGQYGDARHLSPDVLSRDVIPRLDPLSTSF